MTKMPTVQQIRMKMSPWWATRTRQAAVAYRQWPTMVSASSRQARARRTQHRRQRRRGGPSVGGKGGQHRPGRHDRDAGQHPEADGVHHGFVRVRQVVTRQKGELWRTNTNAGEIEN
uniref:Uncharacterized protein n=1 Tax=Aegilops tauschii subsp. strangulata TaxID=200361 RepID=A0A453JLQ3_AEGTS